MEALEGHRYLLTPTHEEMVKIAYELANFYAEQKRVREADQVLERVSEDFIERWGFGHKKTYRHGSTWWTYSRIGTGRWTPWPFWRMLTTPMNKRRMSLRIGAEQDAVKMP